MLKILGGVVVGVFVGAVAVEVLNRTRPNFLTSLEDKAGRALGAFRQAFKDGYSAKKPEPSEIAE